MTPCQVTGRHFAFLKERTIMDDSMQLVERARLYDLYGPLLNEHQRSIMELVIYNDLSLNEIAEQEGISKQAVSDLLHRCIALLRQYEKKLSFLEKIDRLSEELALLEKNLEEDSGDNAKCIAAASRERISELFGLM